MDFSSSENMELIDAKPLITFPFLENIRDKPLPHNFNIMRHISCETGILTHPHGSVKYSQGHTSLIAAVYGPTEVRMSKELYHRGAVDVLYRPKVTGASQLAQSNNPIDPTYEERRIENVLIGIFETSIYLEDIAGSGYNIIVHEYENDGGILAAAVNATTIALLDGGCSLRHSVAGVNVVLTKDNKLIIDPSMEQLKSGIESEMTFVFSNDLKVLYNSIKGHLPTSVMKIALEEALEGAKELFKYYHTLTYRKCKSLESNNALEMPSKNPSSSSRMHINACKFEIVKEEPEEECLEISSDDDDGALSTD